MNGLHTLNWILWIALIISIWDMSIGQYLITMFIAAAFGLTERWLGNEEEKEKHKSETPMDGRVRRKGLDNCG